MKKMLVALYAIALTACSPKDGITGFSLDEIPACAGAADTMFEGNLLSEVDAEFTGGRRYGLAVDGSEVNFELEAGAAQMPALEKALEEKAMLRLFWLNGNEEKNPNPDSRIKLGLNNAVLALPVNGDMQCLKTLTAVYRVWQ